MAAAELTLAGVGQPQATGTKGITAYLETPGSPNVEVFRVNSEDSGDFIYSRKFIKIKTVHVQNHGATIGTGKKDPPKVVVTQGNETGTTMAKVTLYHDNDEVYSIIIFGDM